MAAIASLPMYDLAEVRAYTDALWAGIAQAMRRAGVKDVPEVLTREYSCASLWARNDLLFSQTCGYPLMHEFKSVLRPVATPRYRAPGCRGPEYSSAVMVQADSKREDLAALRGAVCAVNSSSSQSGYSALRTLIAPLAGGKRFFSRVQVTGSHLGSIEAVASGAADVCAVDCVTHALLELHCPSALDGTRVLRFTPCCPGLPFVTRAGLDPDQFLRLRAAVHEALSDPEGEAVRDALLISGADDLDFRDYRPVLEMESRAVAEGYAEIR